MKQLLTLILLICGCVGTTLDTTYFDTNYNHIFKNAQRDNKNIIIDFYTNWCGGCRQYDKHTFIDSTFKQYVLNNFYSTKINAELVQNKEITKRYSIHAYPTIIVANPNGEEIDRIVGYKGDDIKKFIFLLNNVLKGKEKLKYLDSLYSASSDSIELMRKIAIEKLIGKEDYKNLMRFSETVINKSHKSAIKDEARFFYAYGAINDNLNPNPQPIKDILTSNVFKDSLYIEECNLQLLHFYDRLNLTDSIDHYYSILVKFTNPGGHLGYVRDYSRFLYENNRKINIADNLTKEYSSHPGNEGDHWTPFLLAHSAAKHNNIMKGVDIFDNWMNKYSPPGKEDKSIWPYSFYIDYAIYYKVSLKKALEYAKVLEGLNASKNYKTMVAKLLYLNNQREKSIEKLNEVIALVETEKEKNEIDELIKLYKGN
jgi:thioredoxin-related protein